MILLDFSPVVIANLMVELHGDSKKEYLEGKKLNADLVRHMILNSIRAYNVKFRKEFGEMVIACDGYNCWRNAVFPHYKHKRKEQRDDTDVDWDDIYRVLKQIRNELTDHGPYRVLRVDGAEADDIIAVLAKRETNPVLIISGDKDFQQLQEHKNIKQIAPVSKEFIVCKNPHAFLKEQIIRGDTGDSIPNFLSADDCFVTKTRQKSIMQKKLDVWLGQAPEEIIGGNQDWKKNWERNKVLIDLNYIPDDIQTAIVEAYKQPPKGTRTTLLNYMMKQGMVVLLDSIQDF